MLFRVYIYIYIYIYIILLMSASESLYLYKVYHYVSVRVPGYQIVSENIDYVLVESSTAQYGR